DDSWNAQTRREKGEEGTPSYSPLLVSARNIKLRTRFSRLQKRRRYPTKTGRRVEIRRPDRGICRLAAVATFARTWVCRRFPTVWRPWLQSGPGRSGYVQRLLLPQFLFDRGDDFRRFRVRLRAEAGGDLAVAADQKLFEVPRDRTGVARVGAFGGEELIERRD